jgi:heme exporter protein B
MEASERAGVEAARVPGGGRPSSGPVGASGPGLQPSYLRQLGAVVRKDLVVELRSRQRIVAMAAFTVLVGVLFSYTLDPTVAGLVQNSAPGLVWMTLIFAGLVGVGRTFQLETEDGAFQGVLTSPIPKDALYLAKVLSNYILVMLIVLLELGVFGLFFDLNFGEQPLVVTGVVALGALGFVALTTLFAAVSSATTMGETLLPVLLFPLLVPMIIYGASATGSLLAGRPFSAVEGSVRMLGVFTLVALLAGAILFRHVVEE